MKLTRFVAYSASGGFYHPVKRRFQPDFDPEMLRSEAHQVRADLSLMPSVFGHPETIPIVRVELAFEGLCPETPENVSIDGWGDDPLAE